MSDPYDYYELLGVSPQADAAEIKKAAAKALKNSHPDSGGTSGLFRLVNQARHTLLDPTSRRDYDARRHHRIKEPTVDYVTPHFQNSELKLHKPVITNKFSWKTRIEQTHEVTYHPALRNYLFMLAGIIAIITITALPGIIEILNRKIAIAAVVVIFTIPLVLRLITGLRLNQNTEKFTYWGLFAACGFLILAIWRQSSHIEFVWLSPFIKTISIVPYTVAVITLIPVSKYLTEARQLQTILPAAASSTTEWGKPGNTYPHDSLPCLAARLTCDLLSSLSTIPGTIIFHDLVVAEAGILIDHAVLHGNQFAIIHNMAAPEGEYAIDEHGYLTLNDQPYPAGTDDISNVYLYWQHLLPNFNVHSFIVIHSPGIATTSGEDCLDNLSLVAAADVPEKLGNWITQGKLYTVYRPELATILAHHKE